MTYQLLNYRKKFTLLIWGGCTEGETIVCYRNLGISSGNENNIVRTISFRPTKKITLGQVIDKYGVPNKVAVFINEYPPWISISLIFEKIQTIVDLSSQEGDVYTADTSSEVVNIAYKDINSLERFINQSNAQVWKGYGDYKLPDLP